MLPGDWRRILRVPRAVRDQARRDVDDEITFHLAMRADELMAAGMSPDQARRTAAEEFGDPAEARADLESLVRRGERRARLRDQVEELSGDVRYGLRGLRRSPGFTAVAIGTLALAVGANVAIFSIAHAVMFRPLPYTAPDRLVAIWESRAGGSDRNNITDATLIDWRNAQRSFSHFGAYSWLRGAALAGDGSPEEARAVDITREVLGTLGVTPALGRGFSPEEATPGGPRAVLLGWSFWQRRFGGDTSMLDRTISIDDVDHRVAGVMGPEFDFPHQGVDLWPVLRLADSSDGANRNAHRWRAVGRLAPGVQVAAADAELDAISARLESSFPEEMEGWRANVIPLRDSITGDVQPLMWVLLGVVGIVLLVASANLANLLLARQSARVREFAVRQALGAGSLRLVRQLVTESTLIAAAGVGTGLVLATVASRGFVALAPTDIPLLDDVGIDGTVLGFALVITLVATFLFGVLPAVRAARTDPAEALAEGSRRGGGRAQRRLRAGVLITQVGLSVILLTGAVLLTRSLIGLQTVDYGFEPRGLLAVSTQLTSNRYAGEEQVNAFYDPLLERVRGFPDVQSVAGTTEPPVVGYQMTWSYAVQGRRSSRRDGMYDARDLRVVTPGYLETMRMRLVAGREIDENDRTETPLVAMVNQAWADETFPRESPLGQRVSFEGHEGPWFEIVGVVGDTRHRGAASSVPAIYVAWEQRQWSWMNWLTLLVRTEGDPAALIRPIERAVWEIDDHVPVRLATPVEDLYADDRARSRFATLLLVGFSVLAVILAGVGLYGVLSYGVSQRRREISVRMALGAEAAGISRWVVGDGLRLCLVGIAIGLPGAVLLGRFIEGLLYRVGARDPVTLVVVPLFLLLVGGLAAWFPARRAARCEPATVLRDT